MLTSVVRKARVAAPLLVSHPLCQPSISQPRSRPQTLQYPGRGVALTLAVQSCNLHTSLGTHSSYHALFIAERSDPLPCSGFRHRHAQLYCDLASVRFTVCALAHTSHHTPHTSVETRSPHRRTRFEPFTRRPHFPLCSQPQRSTVMVPSSAPPPCVHTQDLTLQELAAAASSPGAAAVLRRTALFADESGRAAWLPIVNCLMGEVRDLTAALGAGMQSPAPPLSGLAPGSGGSRWNGVSRAAVTSTVAALGSTLQPPGRQLQLADTAVWALRNRCQRWVGHQRASPDCSGHGRLIAACDACKVLRAKCPLLVWIRGGWSPNLLVRHHQSRWKTAVTPAVTHGVRQDVQLRDAGTHP